MATWIKICGVKTLADALVCAEAGVDAIGLNFAPASPRYLEPVVAAQLVCDFRETKFDVEFVGVFVDTHSATMRQIADAVGLNSLQLHGNEAPAVLDELLSEGRVAFKAERIATEADVIRADTYAGERILVDAKVAGAQGGTGHTFDWSLISGLNRRRSLILAGGLRPDNVEQAVRAVAPFGIDTASGVEFSPGIKDPERVRSFVRKIRTLDSLRSPLR